MIFEFDIYRLRKPISEDAEGFIEITKDKEAMKYYGEVGAFFENISDAQKQVDWCNNQFDANAGRWIIYEKGRDEYIGDIGFNDFVEKHKRVELGYRLLREYWGKGIITNFIHLLLDWGFTELGYNRVEALVDKRNEGSKVVLLRNNFQFEGVLREYEFEHGKYIDLEMYSILGKDFINKRQTS